MAGAAHLLNDSGRYLKVRTKRRHACLILILSTRANYENMAYRSFRSETCSARGVRKVTTWIPGLHTIGVLVLDPHLLLTTTM